LIANEKQVCEVNTRGGSTTQDPDYPGGHVKRKEQVVLKAKKNLLQENSQMKVKIVVILKIKGNDIFLSDAETEENNVIEDEEEEPSPNDEVQQNLRMKICMNLLL
jgi:hypothetical protein